MFMQEWYTLQEADSTFLWPINDLIEILMLFPKQQTYFIRQQEMA